MGFSFTWLNCLHLGSTSHFQPLMHFHFHEIYHCYKRHANFSESQLVEISFDLVAKRADEIELLLFLFNAITNVTLYTLCIEKHTLQFRE